VTLNSVREVRVGSAVVDETETALREAGGDGYELFVLWTGHLDQDSFEVEHAYVPRQRSYKMRDGLCVRVEADELHELNVWLYEQRQQLGIQIHTHPRRAYHSDTDDEFPIVTTLGGISVVVPRFCRSGLSDPGTMVYRLTPRGWLELDRASALSLVPSLSTP
jgi:hypothetical protein